MGSFRIEGIRPSISDLPLRKYVSVPSTTHGYSLAIEYIQNWILNKYPKDFFKTVHVNGKHVLADYRKFKRNEKRLVEKPALAIVPTVNTDYNRDNVDLIQGGLNLFTRRSSFDDNFLQDYDNNIFIGMQMKQIEMPVSFKIRVKTRAQQLDMLEYTRLACRIGSTQGEHIDIDCHVPYDIMVAVALDCGFELVKDINDEYRIKDVVGFLNYLNSHSQIPFSYKYRTANGRDEFFIRLKGSYVHISCLEGVSIDDGERQGHLDNNFHIEFTATLTFPTPAIFVYRSLGEHRIMYKEPRDINALYQIVAVGPPEVDENNWRKYLSTQWIEPEKTLEDIEFEPLLENNNLKRVMKYTIDTGLSPRNFMNIKVYNGQREIPVRIDWENYVIKPKVHKVVDEVTDIAIYADLNYINDTINNLDHIDKSRMSKGVN